MKIFFNFVLIFLFWVLGTQVVFAQVVINEIAWMGSANGTDNRANAKYEWIELLNSGSVGVSLSGWVLEAVDGTPSIVLDGLIGPGEYFLLERTDDNATVPGVVADLVYGTGGSNWALKNDGETLVIKDGGGMEIDRIDGSDNWKIGGAETIGDNNTKQTAQRTSSGWITADPTPRAANQQNIPEPPLPPPLTPEPEPAPVETQAPQTTQTEESNTNTSTPTPEPTVEESAPTEPEIILTVEAEEEPQAQTSESESSAPVELVSVLSTPEIVEKKIPEYNPNVAKGSLETKSISIETDTKSADPVVQNLDSYLGVAAVGASGMPANTSIFWWILGVITICAAGIAGVFSMRGTFSASAEKSEADEYKIIDKSEEDD